MRSIVDESIFQLFLWRDVVVRLIVYELEWVTRSSDSGTFSTSWSLSSLSSGTCIACTADVAKNASGHFRMKHRTLYDCAVGYGFTTFVNKRIVDSYCHRSGVIPLRLQRFLARQCNWTDSHLHALIVGAGRVHRQCQVRHMRHSTGPGRGKMGSVHVETEPHCWP
jgi:hypothetical protein